MNIIALKFELLVGVLSVLMQLRQEVHLMLHLNENFWISHRHYLLERVRNHFQVTTCNAQG